MQSPGGVYSVPLDAGQEITDRAALMQLLTGGPADEEATVGLRDDVTYGGGCSPPPVVVEMVAERLVGPLVDRTAEVAEIPEPRAEDCSKGVLKLY